ncbi:MAG: permease-like cell division protein FtsX [Nitrospira sp.]|nr:permease-like cell division protein FtsX [Nitrospira sp.]MDE0485576.1 permease-like cell division protein FtsX [Nitrospira sp.]
MRLLYLLREAMNNLRVNRGNVLIGIVTTAFTLVCFGVFLLLYLNLKNVTGTLQGDVEVIVYLDPGASEQVVSLIQKRLETEPAVVTLTLVSREQALQEFSEQFPEESLLLEEMDSNPLPASVVVNLSPRFLDTESLSAFAERVKQLPGVTHVAYSQDWVDTLTLVVSYFELGAAVIGMILAMATVTIIANTIRLSLHTRKEEIEILRLIGATGVFIAIPYVIEGTILGAMGGGLSLALLKGVFEFFRLELDASGWFVGVEHILPIFPNRVSFLLVMTGMLLGCGSSMLSVFGLMKARS